MQLPRRYTCWAHRQYIRGCLACRLCLFSLCASQLLPQERRHFSRSWPLPGVGLAAAADQLADERMLSLQAVSDRVGGGLAEAAAWLCHPAHDEHALPGQLLVHPVRRRGREEHAGVWDATQPGLQQSHSHREDVSFVGDGLVGEAQVGPAKLWRSIPRCSPAYVNGLSFACSLKSWFPFHIYVLFQLAWRKLNAPFKCTG